MQRGAAFGSVLFEYAKTVFQTLRAASLLK